MHSRIRLLCGAVVASFFTTAVAAPSLAQVVQLPTIHNFSYSGSVLAPDRGSTSLGGSSSNRAYSSQYGRPRSRSLGSAANAGNATVYAHVIDLDELDRQIRGLAPASAPTTPGSRVPPRTNKRSMTWRSGAVAGIHTRPHKDELNDPRSSQRRQTLNDFTPGDYMMLLSHPGLVKDAYASVPPVPILPAAEEKATGKKKAKPIAKKVSAN